MGNVTIQKDSSKKPRIVQFVPIVLSKSIIPDLADHLCNDDHFVIDACNQIAFGSELDRWAGLYTGFLKFGLQHNLKQLSECPLLIERGDVGETDYLSQYLKVSAVMFRTKDGQVRVMDTRNTPDTTFVGEDNNRKRVNFAIDGILLGSGQPYVLFGGRINMVTTTLTMEEPDCDDLEILGFQLFGHRVNYNEGQNNA